jgi:hypothetical protein
MAGSIVVTQLPSKSRYGQLINTVQIAWTSDASGNVTVALDPIYGFLAKVITTPGGGGVAPTSYNLKLLDSLDTLGALDALAGSCATRSATVTEQKQPIIASGIIPVLLAGSYTFSIDTAGNAKQGTAFLFLVEKI